MLKANQKCPHLVSLMSFQTCITFLKQNIHEHHTVSDGRFLWCFSFQLFGAWPPHNMLWLYWNKAWIFWSNSAFFWIPLKKYHTFAMTWVWMRMRVFWCAVALRVLGFSGQMREALKNVTGWVYLYIFFYKWSTIKICAEVIRKATNPVLQCDSVFGRTGFLQICSGASVHLYNTNDICLLYIIGANIVFSFIILKVLGETERTCPLLIITFSLFSGSVSLFFCFWFARAITICLLLPFWE